MIKWEEFDHIHVVRKIREVLGSWFHTDLFVADDQGRLRNFDKGQKKLWANTLLANTLHHETAYEYVCQLTEKVTHHFHKDASKHHEFPFLDGLHGVAYPIHHEGEYLGAVIALTYRKDPSHKADASFFKHMESFGVSHADAEKAWNATKCIQGTEYQYFKELVDIVAQEMVTLYKEIATRESRIEELNSHLNSQYAFNNMVGKSKGMQDLQRLLMKIQGSESTCMIQGENGTGKELIARAIHFNSPRKDKTFLPINCAAFNDNLLESELFGHVKGAFTGAVRDRKGYFELADTGTLFMDEIGDISPAMQVKLLRVLQDGSYTPVGGGTPQKTRARIIAATNRDLKAMVEEGTFRQDLYYRLNVITINVPPLRERKEDIPLLVEHFLAKSAKEKNIPTKILNKRTMEILYDYTWPGNIRELENEMERVTVLSGDEARVPPELLSPRIREIAEKSKVQGSRLAGKLKDAIEDLEKDMIREGLRRTGWNKSKLAKELGISRAGLIMKVEKYGLDKRKILRAEGGAVDHDEYDSTGTDD